MSWDRSTMVGLKMEPSDELRYIRKPSNVIACNIFAGVKKNTALRDLELKVSEFEFES